MESSGSSSSEGRAGGGGGGAVAGGGGGGATDAAVWAATGTDEAAAAARTSGGRSQAPDRNVMLATSIRLLGPAKRPSHVQFADLFRRRRVRDAGADNSLAGRPAASISCHDRIFAVDAAVAMTNWEVRQ